MHTPRGIKANDLVHKRWEKEKRDTPQIMTLNINGLQLNTSTYRAEGIATLIKETNLDIVCVQGINNAMHKGILRCTMQGANNHVRIMVSTLLDRPRTPTYQPGGKLIVDIIYACRAGPNRNGKMMGRWSHQSIMVKPSSRASKRYLYIISLDTMTQQMPHYQHITDSIDCFSKQTLKTYQRHRLAGTSARFCLG